MSYNIDTFKVKEISDLIIPVSSLYQHERKDWHPEKEDNDDGTTSFSICEEVVVSGVVNGDFLFVSHISCCGEGSGTAMGWILEPALKESTGRFVASCVWEGGDTINQLVVDGGSVSWTDIDI